MKSREGRPPPDACVSEGSEEPSSIDPESKCQRKIGCCFSVCVRVVFGTVFLGYFRAFVVCARMHVSQATLFLNVIVINYSRGRNHLF